MYEQQLMLLKTAGVQKPVIFFDNDVKTHKKTGKPWNPGQESATRVVREMLSLFEMVGNAVPPEGKDPGECEENEAEMVLNNVEWRQLSQGENTLSINF